MTRITTVSPEVGICIPMTGDMTIVKVWIWDSIIILSGNLSGAEWIVAQKALAKHPLKE
jgi:hypothetical protein